MPLSDSRKALETASKRFIGASSAVSETREKKISKNDIVYVQSRTRPGINEPGGIARVSKVYEGGNSIKYDVNYVLGGREKQVDEAFVTLKDDNNTMLSSCSRSAEKKRHTRQRRATTKPESSAAVPIYNDEELKNTNIPEDVLQWAGLSNPKKGKGKKSKTSPGTPAAKKKTKNKHDPPTSVVNSASGLFPQEVLAGYHYLQLLRAPLTFDQLVGDIEYVNSEDKSCVRLGNTEYGGTAYGISWSTAFSNNILRAGRHYVTFEVIPRCTQRGAYCLVGLMRPGQANQNACDLPYGRMFFQNFSPSIDYDSNKSKVQCCMYNSLDGDCISSNWSRSNESHITDRSWDGIESMSSGGEIGMLLDLDEGTLSVYKNGRKLGVMKRGLVGPYCWVATMLGDQVTIKRGTIPPS